MTSIKVLKPFILSGKRVEVGEIVSLDNSSDKVSRLGDILNSGKGERVDPEEITTRKQSPKKKK